MEGPTVTAHGPGRLACRADRSATLARSSPRSGRIVGHVGPIVGHLAPMPGYSAPIGRTYTHTVSNYHPTRKGARTWRVCRLYRRGW
jgi:hypothetical protein